jgi:predicted amidohydrolase
MPEDGHCALAAFQALAAELGAWLLVGSLTVRIAGETRVANRSLLLDPAGEIVARYDKIHMYDVDVPDGENHRESKNFRPGAEAVVAPTPWGRLGMTVCYDLRFAQLYRVLAQSGAIFLTIPSAFTKVTGAVHWHVLMRARAIETGSFVLAPAQTGHHPGHRQTFGHSMVVDPWGHVLAEAGEEPGVITARIDPAAVTRARTAIPALAQDRDFALAVEHEETVAIRASA